MRNSQGFIIKRSREKLREGERRDAVKRRGGVWEDKEDKGDKGMGKRTDD